MASEEAKQRSDSAANVQRHWRGLHERWKVMKQLTWVVSSGLDKVEEQDLFDLGAFLAQEDLAAQLERRGSLAGPLEIDGSEKPKRPAISSTKLSFPLQEAGVLDLVSALCRKQLPSKAFVVELLTKQAELLKALPNVCEYTVPANVEMCIVGDIHGQFNDLMHIFRTRGFPSATRPYLFNGDFVDRGDCGVEVTLTMFAWQQLFPGSVFLNRGNHEERSVHSMYGFQQECLRKYDRSVYELFNVAFTHLPIGAILNGAVLVVHGGIDNELELEKLREAPRAEYVVNVSGGTGGQKRLIHPAMRARMAEIEARDKRQRPINSALWNDPMQCEGILPNKPRGTGNLFGPDVAKSWLEREGLGLIVRSHEQVREGFDWPFAPGESCVTVFSASNYAGKTQNKGAVALLSAPGAEGGASERVSAGGSAALAGAEGSAAAAGGTSGGGDGQPAAVPMSYTYPFGTLRFLQHEAEHISGLRVEQRNVHKLRCLCIKYRAELLKAYTEADEPGTKRLPVGLWASITTDVLKVSFGLMPLRHHLLGPSNDAATIDYAAFLRRFQLVRPELDPLYRRHEYLLALMYKVDAEGAGSVTPQEFAKVCAVMATQFEAEAAGELCADPEKLLAALGPVGTLGIESGKLDIGAVGDQFRVRPEHGQRPSLLALMHHLDRHDIQNLVRPAVPMEVNEGDEGSPPDSGDEAPPPSLLGGGGGGGGMGLSRGGGGMLMRR